MMTVYTKKKRNTFQLPADANYKSPIHANRNISYHGATIGAEEELYAEVIQGGPVVPSSKHPKHDLLPIEYMLVERV